MGCKKIYHLYIHFPFCSSKCDYCGFYSIGACKPNSLKFQTLYKQYFEGLVKQLQYYLQFYDLSEVKTVFVGGGSPSLYEGFIIDLTKILSMYVDLSKFQTIYEQYEFSIECNIGQVTPDFINNCLSSYVNRFSVGIQSFNAAALERFHRQSSHNHTENVYQILDLFQSFYQKKKFRLSIDLINNLVLNPSEVKKEMQTLDSLLTKYEFLTHLSVYDLTIDENTVLAGNSRLLNQLEKNEDSQEIYSDLLAQILSKHDFCQYEVSNYAKKGDVSLHNLGYWDYENYLGLGPSAHSTIDNVRIENVPNVYKYIKYCRAGEFDKAGVKTVLSQKERIQEFLLMKLRLLRQCDYLNTENFFAKFGLDFEKTFPRTIERYLKEDFLKLIYDSHQVGITPKGINYLNQILTDFFIELDERL